MAQADYGRFLYFKTFLLLTIFRLEDVLLGKNVFKVQVISYMVKRWLSVTRSKWKSDWKLYAFVGDAEYIFFLMEVPINKVF